MGIGDELMMAGEARRQAAGSARRYGMLDKYGRPRFHVVWQGNPNIARPREPCDGLIGYVNGRRPYVVDETQIRRVFRPYQPTPAQIQLTGPALALKERAAGAVVFHPSIKHRAPINKDWGLDRWKRLIAENPDLPWVQIGEPGTPRVRGVERVETYDFFQACGLVAGAAAVVCHEGALHHAAAAFDTPAVVIRGGYISPRVTGYPGQVDLYIEDARWPQHHALGCGMRIACEHCAAAMAAITCERVAAAVRGLLEQRRAA